MNRFNVSLTSGITLFVFLACLTIVLPASAEWVILQKQDPEIRDYMSIAFTSSNTGWAVGVSPLELDNPGFIGYTMDGGKTWNKAEIAINAQLAAVYFLDKEHGWAIGEKGAIAATTDGKNWEVQTSKVGNGLKGIHFVNKDVGYAAGESDTIIATTNGGRSWKVLQGGQVGQVGDDDANMYNAIQFLDESTGWVAGVRVTPSTQGQSALIQRTEDGGKSWVTQETGKEDILEDIFFLDASTGWAVGENGVILHTTNGGKTWKEQMSGTEEKLRSVQFANDKMGIAVGGDLGVGVILLTNDGGETWEAQDPGDPMVQGFQMNKVFIFEGKDAWVTGGNGVILQMK